MGQLRVYLQRNTKHDFYWKVCKINDIEQPKWQQTPGYPSLESYCTEEVKKNKWKGAAIDSGEDDAFITFRN